MEGLSQFLTSVDEIEEQNAWILLLGLRMTWRRRLKGGSLGGFGEGIGRGLMTLEATDRIESRELSYLHLILLGGHATKEC